MIKPPFAALALVLATLTPPLLADDWLITTHSGNDVLLADEEKKSAQPLVRAGAGGLDQARGITYGPNDDLFVCSAGSHNWAVLRFDGQTGKPKGTFAAGEGLTHPYQCLFGPDGDLYVSAQDNGDVFRYDGKNGRFKSHFVKRGAGGLQTIRGIVFHPEGDLLVAGRDNDAILRFNGTDGKFVDFFVKPKAGDLHQPIQLHYGPDGHLYVGSSGNDRIKRFHGKTGEYIDNFVKHGDGGLKSPSGFAWASNGDLYVASRKSDQILRYDGKTGKFKEVAFDTKHLPGLHHPEFILPAGN
jgi:streptogramin lyase